MKPVPCATPPLRNGTLRARSGTRRLLIWQNAKCNWKNVASNSRVKAAFRFWKANCWNAVSQHLAQGTLEMEAGVWAFVAGDVGGLDATRAGGATVEHTRPIQLRAGACRGNWPGVLALTARQSSSEAVESRCAHALPIENFVIRENAARN